MPSRSSCSVTRVKSCWAANVDALIPDSVRSRHAAHRAGYWEKLGDPAYGAGAHFDGAAQKDGRSEFPVEISLSPVRSEDGLQR